MSNFTFSTNGTVRKGENELIYVTVEIEKVKHSVKFSQNYIANQYFHIIAKNNIQKLTASEFVRANSEIYFLITLTDGRAINIKNEKNEECYLILIRSIHGQYRFTIRDKKIVKKYF